jgi:hypothetical protein
MSKCNLSIGHFDSHGSAPVQYEAHCPMQYGHWKPLDAAIGQVLCTIT